MPRYRTPEEVERDHLERLPPDLGLLYNRLSAEVSTLRLNWEQLLALFTSKEIIAVLVNTAETFFDVLYRTLRRDILLGVARLTDKPRHGKHENASLLLLAERARPRLPDDAQLDLDNRLARVVELAAPIRQLRDKRIAHIDLKALLDQLPEPLPGVSRYHISEVLDEIGAVLNCIELPLLGSTTLYSETIHSGGADALVIALKMAQEHEQCLRRRDGAV